MARPPTVLSRMLGAIRAEKPTFMQWGDLIAKLLLPIVIAIATFLYNGADEARKREDDHKQALAAASAAKADAQVRAQQTCVDQQLKLIAVQCDGKDCAGNPDKSERIIRVGQFVKILCNNAGMQLAEPTDALVRSASIGTLDAGASAAGLAVVGATAPKKVEVPYNPGGPNPPVILATPRDGAPAGHGQLLVYIQYGDETPTTDAEAVRKRLSQSTLNGERISAPGVQKVKAVPSHTELRCFKVADCAQAGKLAAYIGGFIGLPPIVRDFHARFETVPTVKPGTFELWFAPGPAFASGSSGGSF